MTLSRFPLVLVMLVLWASIFSAIVIAQSNVPHPPGFDVQKYGNLQSNVFHGAVLVADFDRFFFREGDIDRMDVLMTGLRAPRALDTANNFPFTGLYKHVTTVERSESGEVLRFAYPNVVTDLGSVYYSDAAASDYDNDGDLDLVFQGLAQGPTLSGPITRVWKNNGNATFEEVSTAIPGLYYGSVAWGDYDGDGDDDLLLTGVSSGGFRTLLYRNAGQDQFELVSAGLENIGYGDAAWGDYDGDGDLDILLSGSLDQQRFITKVYRNEGGRFVDAAVPLPGLAFSQVAWFDYDSDGRLDMVLTGGFLDPFIMQGKTSVYRNLGNGQFQQISVEGEGYFDGDLAVGDFDQDGDPDFVISGRVRATERIFTQLYRNDGDAFNIEYSVQETVSSAFTLADYDRDRDLDIFITGFNPNATGLAPPSTQYYVNLLRPNSEPGAPTGLQATVNDQNVTFSWDAAFDAQTPAPGLTYNIRVGTFPGGANVISGMADPASGLRWLSAPGNAGARTKTTLTLPRGSYYWSVQALDASYAGSAFAAEAFFTTGDPNDQTPPTAPAGLVAAAGDQHIVLSWQPNTEPDLSLYRIYRGTSPGAETLIAVVDPGKALYIDATAQSGTTYFYRMTALDETGNESGFSNEVSAARQVVFTQIGLGFNFLGSGSVTWGDYDGDRDLDFLLPSRGRDQIWRNEQANGTFFPIRFAGQSFFGVNNADGVWGDYDGDGDLDLVVAGSNFAGQPSTSLYQNNGSRIDQVTNVPFPGLAFPSAAWGDYDNDGDLDLALAGQSIFQDTTLVYRNEGSGVFVDARAGLAPTIRGTLAWGDYDGDEDLDLLVAGRGQAIVYRNDTGIFTDINAGLAGVGNASAAWGDYDNDGDLDLVITGRTQPTGEVATRLYRNDGGQFINVNVGIAGSEQGALAWGDYDGDGDLDLVVAGLGRNGPLTRIYVNERGTFLDAGITIESVGIGDVAWGDYDNDGDLDLLLTSQSGTTNNTRLYRNDLNHANAPPLPPPTVSPAEVTGNTVILRWNAGVDDHTPTPALSYNLLVVRVGATALVVPPMSDPVSGYRFVSAFGNVGHNTEWRLTDLPNGSYLWQVQTVDHGFQGSPFTASGTFTVGPGKDESATDTENEARVPRQVELETGYPNPVRDLVTIRYDLPNSADVHLAVYDVLGRRVRTLVSGKMAAGSHEARWDGLGESGERVASGLYFYRLEVQDGPVLTRSLTVIR